jgi:hypothetical protein
MAGFKLHFRDGKLVVHEAKVIEEKLEGMFKHIAQIRNENSEKIKERYYKYVPKWVRDKIEEEAPYVEAPALAMLMALNAPMGVFTCFVLGSEIPAFASHCEIVAKHKKEAEQEKERAERQLKQAVG